MLNSVGSITVSHSSMETTGKDDSKFALKKARLKYVEVEIRRRKILVSFQLKSKQI